MEKQVKNEIVRSEQTLDKIEVFHPENVPQIELRKGFSVARPVPRHWHEEYQLCLIQAGAGELVYRGSSLSTPPASLFIVHPGEVHSNNAFSGCSYRTIFIGPELIRTAAREFYGKKFDLPFFPTAVIFDGEIINRYLRLHAAFEQPYTKLEIDSLLLDFLSNIIYRFAENRPALRNPGKEHKAVKRVYEYLTEHYAENISLENLAGIANLSLFHFSRVFSAHFGVPPHVFQTQLRVIRAKKLLRDGLPISQIALDTGFADQSHLNRHFKRLTAVTPGEYKQNNIQK